MLDSYIFSACRTPIGRFRGALSSLAAPDLGAIAVREAVARAHLSPADIDEVNLGNVLPAGVGQAPARQAALRGGLPATVAALTGSGSATKPSIRRRPSLGTGLNMKGSAMLARSARTRRPSPQVPPPVAASPW